MKDNPGPTLVLCTGNSARSQMAQAFLERHAAGRFAAYSAGSEPAEQVHPLAVEVMREVGLEIGARRPKHLDEVLGQVPIRTVIIVCSGANESCPAVLPGVYERLFWPFEDPAAGTGSEEDRRALFRRVRDAIEERIVDWLGTAEAG